MSDFLIMKKLVSGEILTGDYGTQYKLDQFGMLVWKESVENEWHPVCGGEWACLFEDEIFEESV